jgi:hypothetical protein
MDYNHNENHIKNMCKICAVTELITSYLTQGDKMLPMSNTRI